MEIVVVYPPEEPPHAWVAAVFLAGPTPRDPGVKSWRPAAVEALRAGWRGPGRLVVFVPERDGQPFDYVEQVSWEDRCLNLADVVLFWVPRDLDTLPAFTTNVEWGMWHDSGRVVFGAPADAPGNRYLLHYAERGDVPVATTLNGVVDAALAHLGTGEYRQGGEVAVPLLVWRLPSFQRWYAAQRAAGNTLRTARLVWTFRPGTVFSWALHVEVEIAAEGRVKSNEVVISRPDLAAVVLYRPGATLDETEVVLIREFRSPASTPDGFIHELPGGAPESGDGVAEAGLREVAEETGLTLDAGRVRSYGSRQVAGTFSAHHGHLLAAEVTEGELASLRESSTRRDDDEWTTPEVMTFRRIRDERLVDWATLGMLAQVLLDH